jgi:hypothetical protein
MRVGELDGLTGTLFPSRFLADGLGDALATLDPAGTDRARRRMSSWWSTVAAACGPATGLRAIFDEVAMPFAAQLGFRAREPRLESRSIRATLITPGGSSVALIVRPWAARRPSSWREVAQHAAEVGAGWSLVISPPFISVVDARGCGLRHALEVELPAVLAPEPFRRFWLMSRAEAFDLDNRHSLDAIVALGERFQIGVRTDLQRGVNAALDSLAMPPAEALTIVYRVLFLLFVESRGLVPTWHPVYRNAYAITTLCRDAVTAPPRGLWDALGAVTRLARLGCRSRDLIVTPFNGSLFARSAAPSLEARSHRGTSRTTTTRDAELSRALIELGTRPGPAGRESITYADLGVEQLGAIYERVLDRPGLSAAPGLAAGPIDDHRWHGRHSSLRKSTGTFYTSRPLADFVVRRTLAPLVDGRTCDEILQLRVVDPAMGSGAFLVSACRYLADACERALVDEGRLSDADIDEALRADLRRRVAERCLAGVDSNPVAVQLARLSLWLATLADGRPLGFLDHRLRVGNSLIGATPQDLLHVGRAPGGRAGGASTPLLDAANIDDAIAHVAAPLADLLLRRDDAVADVRAKERSWLAVSGPSSPLAAWRRAATLWCARWFWPDDAARPAPSTPELRAAVDRLLRGDRTLPHALVDDWCAGAGTAAARHHFFHWAIEFPDVFHDVRGMTRGSHQGFDAVIGNPPWEMLRRDPDEGGDAGTGDARGGRSPSQLRRYLKECGHFRASSGHHVNLYLAFLERSLGLLHPRGRLGLLVPWGFASDDGAATLRRQLLDADRLDSIVGFDNRAGLFPIHRGVRFAAVFAGAPTRGRAVCARFGVQHLSEVAALPSRDEEESLGDAVERSRPLRIDALDLRIAGGSPRRIPDTRRARDFEWLVGLRRAWPPLSDARSFAATFARDLNATDDRHRLGPRGLPVIEGKDIEPFVARVDAPRARIDPGAALQRLSDGRHLRPRLAYRDVSAVGNRRTLIAAVLPEGVVTTHTLFCLRTPLSVDVQYYLCGLFNSFVLNAVVRMLMGGHLTTTLVEDLPAPMWTGTAGQRRIAAIARRLGHGDAAPGAGREQGERTFARRTRDEAWLQAQVARAYGVDAAAFAALLEGFPLVDAELRTAALAAFKRLDAGRGVASGRSTVAL